MKQFSLTEQTLHLTRSILWRPRKAGKKGYRFEILCGELGRGASGITYKTEGTIAIDEDTDCIVLRTRKIRAIKFFNRTKPSYEGKLALRLEYLHAKGMFKLNPPFGESHFYGLAMKYFSGCTLQQLLSGQISLSLARRCRLTLNVLEAFKTQVIQHQIVHRDLKPANMIVGEEDVVNIIDYGSAVSLDQSCEASESPAVSPVSNRYLSKEELVLSSPVSGGSPLIELVKNMSRYPQPQKEENLNMEVVGTLGFIPAEGYLEPKPPLTLKYDFFALARIIAQIWGVTIKHYSAIQYQSAEEAANDTSYSIPDEMISDPKIKKELELLLKGLSDKDPTQRPELDKVQRFFQEPTALHEDKVPTCRAKDSEHILSLSSLSTQRIPF